MPTVPVEPHRQRHVAESFGADAERYDRTRPRYPDAMVEAIVAASPGPDVIDVGCGTGIAARQFQAAGCRVLGVEVDARMAEFARQGGLDVEVGTFEAWDPADRRFDAVVAGQAWHWVDPVAGAAKAAAVLRPGGRIALFWNAFGPPAGLGEAFSAVYRRVLPEAPMSRTALPGVEAYSAFLTKAAGGMAQTGVFGECERWRFDWDRTYTRDEWLELAPTFGGGSRLPKSTLDELLTGFAAAIDEMGGAFTMRYSAVVVTAARH